MIRLKLAALLAVFSLIFVEAAVAADDGSHVKAELFSETGSLLRGADNALLLKLTPEPDWHVYWLNPGDSGLPTKLEWQLPPGATASAIQWPAPHRLLLGDITSYGYSGAALHLLTLSIPAEWPVNKPFSASAKAKWLACKDICIPGEATLGLTRPVTEGVADLDPAHAEDFERVRALLPLATPGWSARFEAGKTEIAVQFAADPAQPVPAVFPSDAEFDFFPLAGDLVNHGAAQRFAVDGPGLLRMSQALSPYALSAPTNADGVLVVRAKSGETRAYQIAASAGSVAAVALPPASGSSLAEAQTKPDPAELKSALSPGPTPASSGSGEQVLLALLSALLGGLILNLMPCVFPVLSLKALALAQGANGNRREQRAQALSYTAGAVLSCVAAAALLLALRAGGEALGWGFQLQSPVFVAALAYLMFALGLAMSGVIELGSSWMGAGSSLANKNGLTGSFFTGVLAVVVASPCTAPFMGGALGFAVTQPLLIALAVFAALGLGLALPFLLFGFWPALARRLPRPGAWMLSFKQAMAFPLYLTVAWMLWVLTRQAGADALGLAAVGLVLIAFALWLLGRSSRGAVTTALATAALLAAVGLLAAPMLRGGSAESAASAKASQPDAWSAARVAALRAEGRTVFVDFTADWCITCKINERGALASGRVRAAFERENVVTLVADWTRSDPAITAALAEFGRNGVPLYLVYAQGGEPRVLPQVLTPQVLIDALKP